MHLFNVRLLGACKGGGDLSRHAASETKAVPKASGRVLPLAHDDGERQLSSDELIPHDPVQPSQLPRNSGSPEPDTDTESDDTRYLLYTRCYSDEEGDLVIDENDRRNQRTSIKPRLTAQKLEPQRLSLKQSQKKSRRLIQFHQHRRSLIAMIVPPPRYLRLGRRGIRWSGFPSRRNASATICGQLSA